MNADTSLHIRNPDTGDGAAIWQLIKDCAPLDLNSPYLYLLLCEHFSKTCLVAERDGGPVGFVSAYHPPAEPETLFVWQIATHPSTRQQGVAGKMLSELIKLPDCSRLRYIEATVTPDNEASTRLFYSLAKGLHADCHKSVFFGKKLFPERENHDEELLIRIGPLQ